MVYRSESDTKDLSTEMGGRVRFGMRERYLPSQTRQNRDVTMAARLARSDVHCG